MPSEAGVTDVHHENARGHPTEVCFRVRNWSHTRSVSMRMSVYFDASRESQRSCTDFTLISEAYQNGFAKRAMNDDRLQTYVTRWQKDSYARGR